MKRNTFFHSLPIIMAAMMMAACSNEDVAEPMGDNNAEPRTWQVSINAGPATTRAISVGGNNGQTLYTNWDANDAVEVVKGSASVGTLNADVSAGNSAYATLTGTLTGTFNVGDAVTLYYHTAALDYTGQVGTLAGVSTNKSYLTATSTVKSVDGDNKFLSMSDAAFTAMQSYLELSFTDGTNPISITRLDIWADGGNLVKTKALDGTTTYATEAEPLTITPASATNKLFIALRDENGAANKYHFKATTSDNTYFYEGSKNLQYGKYYTGPVAMYKQLSDATAGDQGKLICTAGHIHAYQADPDCTADRVAKIIYVGSSNGLALALTDEGDKDWEVAKTTCSGKNTSLSVTGGYWKLATKDEWDNMITAAGGYVALRDGFSGIEGASNLKSGDYWTSTLYENYTTIAYSYYFNSPGCWNGLANGNNNPQGVRACLAFSTTPAYKATDGDKGKVIGADGNIYDDAAAATAAGTTAVAKIVYVGSDNGESAPYNHGLALALSDANGGSTCKWNPSNTDAGHTKQTDKDNFTSESGLQYNATHNTADYPAFQAAIANNSTAAPTGCSAWFLASGYQWDKMFTAAGGYANLKTNAGLVSSKYYWSSSEKDAFYAWMFGSDDGYWHGLLKDNTYLVRACLAF